ncbi:hypothetical protein QBC37DRAFT_144540 [Rhypophila decipiens]|uniref:Secreted protein n=1 Tax=Rhypophila decipiens TaxID=261697 RepID=A0AAN6YDR7_9PEZI|nr:hypothetical protein QBC37DRAFT_144540 [Rhypophila decipiens]
MWCLVSTGWLFLSTVNWSFTPYSSTAEQSHLLHVTSRHVNFSREVYLTMTRMSSINAQLPSPASPIRKVFKVPSLIGSRNHGCCCSVTGPTLELSKPDAVQRLPLKLARIN